MLLTGECRTLQTHKVRCVFGMTCNLIGFVEALPIAITKILRSEVRLVRAKRNKLFGSRLGGRGWLCGGGCASQGQAKQGDLFFHEKENP